MRRFVFVLAAAVTITWVSSAGAADQKKADQNRTAEPAQKMAVFEGKITHIDMGKREISVSGSRNNSQKASAGNREDQNNNSNAKTVGNKEQRFVVAGNARITVDGKNAFFENLKQDMHARVYVFEAELEKGADARFADKKHVPISARVDATSKNTDRTTTGTSSSK